MARPATGDLPAESSAAPPRVVAVPFERFAGWIERYDAAHPGTEWIAEPHLVRAHSPDGSQVEVEVPGRLALAPPALDALLARLALPTVAGVVLVRRGGFAVALLHGSEVVESKVGRRHVQGRSKAGGWSQQRFARRRENQARAAFDAAAEHAHRVLVAGNLRPAVLGLGGDRHAVASVLAHPDLRALADVPTRWLGGVPNPTCGVLEAAILAVRSVQVRLTDP